MKKIKFTFTKADSKTRTMGIIALVLAVAAIVLLAVSASSALNRSITKLPVMQALATVLEDEFDLDEITEEYDEMIEEIEEAIDDEDEEYLEELEDEFGMDAEEVLELFDPLSLNSLKKLAGMVSDEMEADEAEMVEGVFSALTGFVNGYAILLGFLVALSALFMNKAWFITATSISGLFFFVFVGAVWFVVFLGLCIAYSILVSKVKNAYIISKAADQLAAATAAAPATEA